jgi:hypothetical protein
MPRKQRTSQVRFVRPRKGGGNGRIIGGLKRHFEQVRAVVLSLVKVKEIPQGLCQSNA